MDPRTAPIYLDYNATTPIDPAVVAAMLRYLGERFGNPSSTHEHGVRARAAVETARGEVARLVRAGAVRLTVGRFTTEKEVDRTGALLVERARR